MLTKHKPPARAPATRPAKSHIPSAAQSANKFPFHPGRSVAKVDPMLERQWARVASRKPVAVFEDFPEDDGDDDQVEHIPEMAENGVIRSVRTYCRNPERYPEVLPKSFGVRVALLRTRLKLTRPMLALRAGITTEALIKIERMERSPTLIVANCLGVALGVPFEYLTGGSQ